MTYNFSEYQPTFNKVIDFCVNLVACARANNQPIKALHLKPSQYEWFKSGLQTLMNRPLEDGELMQIDGVEIERASVFQPKEIIAEYYKPLAQA
jgi:hypothetical protein